ncbi:MAG: PEP/pyruvate-binding domain-containing protein, partial [Candidatus Omnitrophica bacterium]|nr:PEP/pyruvate-binding domain-containing protein [Candidatus Omnitrophota bacterium]
IARQEGEGVFYVFDCLSELLSAWSNDLMIGNFFKITCPYLFELNTIAFFALLRNRHSYKTVARIRDTTQVLIDVYHHQGNCYIHPLKVWNRYSPTMFLPHARVKDRYVPIANSADTAELFSQIFKKGSKSAGRNLDYWDKLFMQAEEAAGKKGGPPGGREGMIDQLCRMVIARDEKLIRLAKENLTLEDFLTIKARMIGTGFIGGKSVGMLVARNILLKDKVLQAKKFFEAHDSFFVGADVFYTYIVENGWWKEHMAQRTPEGYFKVAGILREKLMAGVFPEEIKEQLQQMIEYFGQSPIIVRSSSLLEDSYGNAFAGKYESIFLVNQGTPDERYAKLIDAIRRIYASTMSEDALAYRLQRGLDQMDEQMALLVQRVSGSYKGEYFFPDAAGVGISQNVFVWKNGLDPKAGMLRLVAGLGTRAVNRVEGDYPRIVALDDPLLKAYDGMAATQRFSQHDVDVLNIRENAFQTLSFRELLGAKAELHLDRIAIRDDEAAERMKARGETEEPWIITFDPLVSDAAFASVMRRILKTLETAYGYPVDIEYTINFTGDAGFRINVLQCRPMQTKGLGHRVKIPKAIPKEKILFRSVGNFLGGNISQVIDKIIYVDPKGYCELETQAERYDVARAVGELNRQLGGGGPRAVMLLGPGRWGTTTPSLGVPVSFSEIHHISVLGEIAFTTDNISPEVSFGTHFFKTWSRRVFFMSRFSPTTRRSL